MGCITSQRGVAGWERHCLRNEVQVLVWMQVEIVNAFEGKDGLKAFREWVLTPDKDILEEAQRVGRRGKGSKKKGGEPQDPPGLSAFAAILLL